MREFFRIFQRPRYLVAFEAVGRLGSITEAAEEMGLSQSSISAAIRTLEQRIGVDLFDRAHRSMHLTPAGAHFHQIVERALHDMLMGAQGLERNGYTYVSVACSQAFATHCLLPFLGSLKRGAPHVQLDVRTTEHETSITKTGAALGIRRGVSPERAISSTPLVRERLVPVATPEYWARNGFPATPEDLSRHQLLLLSERYRIRPNWLDWFKHNDLEPPNTMNLIRLSDCALDIQAALGDEGIALTCAHFIQKSVSDGLLEVCDSLGWETGETYYLTSNDNIPPTFAQSAVSDWLASRPWEVSV